MHDLQTGQSIRFAMLDSGGVRRESRGRITDFGARHIVVTLTKNWWGSYLRGLSVRVYPDEIIS